jgi:hypothetical protein
VGKRNRTYAKIRLQHIGFQALNQPKTNPNPKYKVNPNPKYKVNPKAISNPKTPLKPNQDVRSKVCKLIYNQ